MKLFSHALIASRPSLPLIGSENVAINAIVQRKAEGSCCAASSQALMYVVLCARMCHTASK